MNSSNSAYEKYKMIAQSVTSPCAILSVEKNEDGTAGDIRLFATNDKFSMTGEMVEGELYTKFLPREPKFDDMCLRAAFGGEKIHTYVDSTKTLGAWSDNILLPLQPDEDGKTGYCQFIYDLTKEMDAGKFSTISPTVAGFVIKSCLELRSDNDFKVNINQVIEDIRIFTDATFACVISMNREKQKSELICQSIEETAMAAGQSFSGVSFDTIDKWDDLIGESDCFIMRDKADIENVVEKVTPKWAQLLRMKGIENLCLVPLQQRKVTVGYILVTNFNLDNLVTIKETLEILSLFVSSEMANNQFLARLEWLTSVDMRTGVRNRAAMNRVVDEYAEQLKWQKYPIGVAFCTMNGLKALNEKNGHDAGNKCLEEAGNILSEIFDETEVFRSAGEEFAVVCKDADEKDFQERIEKLRERGSNPDGVYFAIGTAFDSTEGDLRKALRNANKQMLEEKENFYIKYPDKKRS
ncbi:GGDEF domain-containing protein [Butyrivibrio sp. FC2001]|uniref:GGDEF domain-containing protein n=1 Tax=Butyrivibrio sp. FC2001 TaxID=1280671 RepID=UPI000423A903|nr:GGDEF domain-containing protein [Butyrivibrio sp. FC2001]